MTWAFGYASFKQEPGQPGGWRVRDVRGKADGASVDTLVSWVPTQLNDGSVVPAYPSREQREQLTRRYAWLPAPWNAQERVFFASTSAGQDSTGRPGNVFTYVFVPGDALIGGACARDYVRSPSVPAPFGAIETQRIQIPTDIAEKGPLAEDHVLDLFLDGWSADTEHSPLPMAYSRILNAPADGRRRTLLGHLARILSSGTTPVILVAPLEEADMWVAAVDRALPQDTLTFSTFERFNTIASAIDNGSLLSIVPTMDKKRIIQDFSGQPVRIFTTDEALPATETAEIWEDPSELSTPAVRIAPPDLDTPGGANPFAQPLAQPSSRPEMEENTAIPPEVKEVSDYLRRLPHGAGLSAGIVPTLNELDVLFIEEGTIDDWSRALENSFDNPQFQSITVEQLRIYLCYPPSTKTGHVSRAMILAALSVSVLEKQRLPEWPFATLSTAERESILNLASRSATSIDSLNADTYGSSLIDALVSEVIRRRRALTAPSTPQQTTLNHYRDSQRQPKSFGGRNIPGRGRPPGAGPVTDGTLKN